ncbi:Pentatricopeptide repeat-containing protein [Cynara cardunculus var. scolymus]|uniref:Pentatricopeptide repeat-containing protein n=2 Tax=Cynara cardunculus var. scolymus TaxID=59895 RepID=A0A118K4R8_CYNCS|nr:Pentatricopeptide repeat-containing protein [Cynara cardunculus var. scolymus]
MNILIRRFTSVPTALSDSNLIRKVKHLILQGLHFEALQVYRNQPDLHVDAFISILPSLIKACSLSQTHHGLGLQLHSQSLKMGIHSESVVSNSTISFYAKFPDIKSARKVFDEMPQKDFISWNSMINCFAQNGNCVESLEMLKEMYECGLVAKPELLASILSLCVQCGYTRVGKMIHALSIVDERFEKMVFLSTALLDLYWRSGDSVMAFHVFDATEDKNEVFWTSMIMGYVGNCDYLLAFDCFRQMQVEGIKPNRVTLITILPACVALGTIGLGKDIHGYAFRHGFNSDIRLLSALIHLYSKWVDSLSLAKLIFEWSTQKDIVLWSSIISGCSQHKESAENSILLFNQMQKEGVEPNSVTLLAVLTACTNIPSIRLGSEIHGYVLKSGLDSDLSITNSHINMYSKCGSLKDSHQVFREMATPDCVSWSALINAYGVHGYGAEALQLFNDMKENGMQHDSITLLAVLSACNHSGLVEEGHKLFSEAVKDDKLSVNLEHYACYIDLLGRAGKFDCAREVLRTMPMKPSPKIMSSLVSSCKLHGRLDVAETLLSWFIESEPGNTANHTLLSLIYAEFGKWLNVEGIQRNMKSRGLKKSCGYSRLEY